MQEDIITTSGGTQPSPVLIKQQSSLQLSESDYTSPISITEIVASYELDQSQKIDQIFADMGAALVAEGAIVKDVLNKYKELVLLILETFEQ